MKRLLLSGMFLLSLTGGLTAAAQNSNSTYNDDIYYTEEQAQRDAQKEAERQAEAKKQRQNEEQTYTSTGREYERGTNNRDYANGDDYLDYEDDYYYASHINRFNYPFYNMGYYSGYYNPWWYDRYWVDPMWGYSPWARPGFSISFGYGPYWTSGWGWNTWNGYSGFASYYNYPYYGGYGGYYGCGAGYYNGYWNGYYAGIYNTGYRNGGYRTVSYGPRYSLNGISNSHIRNNSLGYRSTLTANGAGVVNTGNSYNTRSGFRAANGNTGTIGRNGIDNAPRNEDRVNGRTSEVRTYNSSPNRGGFVNRGDNNNEVRYNNGNDRVRNESASPRTFGGNEAAPRERRGFFSGRAEAQPQRTEAPRYEQRTFAQPRTETPRMETPRVEPRTYSQPRNDGGRSFGGSENRGSGGGSFGGGNGGGRSFGGRR